MRYTYDKYNFIFYHGNLGHYCVFLFRRHGRNTKKLDFLGVITGVGGGLLRDMMVCEIPSILKEHIYACASLIGAILYVLSMHLHIPNIGIIVSASVVIIIRVLSRHYDWNLPHGQIS